MRTEFHITELDCSHEVAILRKQFETIDGISRLDFNVINGIMVVEHDPQVIGIDEIIRRVSETGMRAKVETHSERSADQPTFQVSGRLIVTALSASAIVLGSLVHFGSSGSLPEVLENDFSNHSWMGVTLFFYAAAIMIGLWFVVPKAIQSLKNFHADMNVLMCIAIIGAVIVNEWFEAATVAFLFQVALALEQWSMGRARRAIGQLTQLTPQAALKVEGDNNHPTLRPLDEINVGDTILVRPGDRLPLDGIVISGSTEIDQAPITGESMPVSKTIDDEVFAGTINGSGAIEIRVNHRPTDTTLARIIAAIQEAQASRAPFQQTVDQFAQFYTPAMIILALLIGIGSPLLLSIDWSTSFYNALVLLVIACPCALVISTPVTIVAALTSAAGNGVLIKGGRFLESAAGLRAIALDKTGTITYGRPQLTSIVVLDNCKEQQSLSLAASLEQGSSHPIATAIQREATNRRVKLSRVEAFKTIPGQGAQGTIDGDRYWIGSPARALSADSIPQFGQRLAELEERGQTVVALVHDDRPCSLIAVADQTRPHCKEMIDELRRLDIKEVVMLTGDRKSVAQMIASEIGLDRFVAEALPETKFDEIGKLKEKHVSVAMIGDGINDGPALAAADVSIAMANVGTDTAIETADVALLADDLQKIPWLIRHARWTISVIKQNIAFAIGTKAIVVALALFGFASLWLAIAADMGTSLLVIFNGLRLLKIRH